MKIIDYFQNLPNNDVRAELREEIRAEIIKNNAKCSYPTFYNHLNNGFPQYNFIILCNWYVYFDCFKRKYFL